MNMKERKNMSDRFEVFDMPIPGLKLIQRKPFGDNRGYFERFFCQNELKELLGTTEAILSGSFAKMS